VLANLATGWGHGWALTQSWCNSRRSCAASWWRMSIMGHGLLLAPCGLVVEHMQSEAGDLVITARPALRTAACPACGSASARVHSTYQRSLADLPSHGQTVRIRVSTRRFRCVLASCRQRIFTERLAATAARPFARRTSRHRASSRPGLGWAARAKLRASPSPAGQQGHFTSRRPASCSTADRGAARGRHR